MANLVGSDIGLNYKGLINLGATVNQNVSGSLQYLTDGDGNNLPIQVSTTATQLNYGVGIGGAPTTAGLQVYGQAGTTGLVFGGAAATMYIDLNGTGLNFFDAAQTRYRNFTNTLLAMNVWGSLGMVAIGGSPASPYTPSALLQIRGDGTNPIFRAENSSGTALVTITNNGSIQSFVGTIELGPTSSGIYFSTNGIIQTVASNGLFIRYGAHTGMPNGITLTSNSDLPITATSGTNRAVGIVSTFAAAAGNANYRPLSLEYTINNTGAQTGTATGIFLNATQTNLNGMPHNLMDLRNGGISRLSVDSTGMVTAANGFMEGSGFTSRLYQNNLQLYSGNTMSGFIGGGGFTMNTKLYIGATAVTPVARLTVRGDGTNPIARFENSAGVEAFGVSNTGVVNFSTTSGTITITPGITPILSLSTFFASGGGLQIQMNVSALSGAGTISKFVFTQAYTLTGASATNINELVINPSFSATANPGVFNGILFSSTINQTSGANGITRGLYVNPTLTAAADFRAVEVRTGSTAAHKLMLLTNAAGNKVFEVNAAQEIGLFGVAPITQPTTAISPAAVTPGGGTAILEDDLFAGYTVAQIAQALVNLGILKP